MFRSAISMPSLPLPWLLSLPIRRVECSRNDSAAPYSIVFLRCAILVEDADKIIQFETLEWSLEPEEGEKISLMGAGTGSEPFQQETADKIAVAV